MNQKWKAVLFVLISGIALGFGTFYLIHRWEPGFTNFRPAGVIYFEDPVHALLHSILSGFGICYGVVVALAGMVAVFLDKGARKSQVPRRAGYLIVTFGMMIVCQAELQLRYDRIYPSAAAIDELTHACAESGKQPCMTLPLGDR